jgi:hypothetical protein
MSNRKLATLIAGPDNGRVESIRRQVIDWVSGQKVPNEENVLRIAAALEADPAPLLEARTNSSTWALVRRLQAGLAETQERIRALEDRLDPPAPDGGNP